MNRIQTDTLRPQRNPCSKSTDQLSRWHSIANYLSPTDPVRWIFPHRETDVAHATDRFFPWAKWIEDGWWLGAMRFKPVPPVRGRDSSFISTHSPESVGFLWAHKKSACVQMNKAPKKITPRNCSSTTRLHKQNNYEFLKEGSFPVCSIRLKR